MFTHRMVVLVQLCLMILLSAFVLQAIRALYGHFECKTLGKDIAVKGANMVSRLALGLETWFGFLLALGLLPEVCT